LAYWGNTSTPQAADTGRKELARFLPVLEQALATREWLEGDFSLADIAFVPHLWLVEEGGYDFASTPRVRAWVERMLARPAWKKAMELVFVM
jgi:GST-like protein